MTRDRMLDEICPWEIESIKKKIEREFPQCAIARELLRLLDTVSEQLKEPITSEGLKCLRLYFDMLNSCYADITDGYGSFYRRYGYETGFNDEKKDTCSVGKNHGNPTNF